MRPSRVLRHPLVVVPAVAALLVVGWAQYTQARDGILSAVAVLDPDDLDPIRAGFVKRGMGRDAVSPPSSSTSLAGVVEDFATWTEGVLP